MAANEVSFTVDQVLRITIGFYVVSVLSLALRLASITWYSKGIYWDNILMVFVFAVYTSFMGLLNASCRYPTNLIPAEQLASILLDRKEIYDRTIGSILVISVEQSLLLTLWGIKLCVLGFMYPISIKMYKGTFILKSVAAYIIASYLIIEILYFGVLCVPFRQYWAIMVINQQCATYLTYYQVHLALNSTAYVLLMAAAIAIIASWQLAMSRRMIVAGLLCTGVFIVAAAILSKYYKLSMPGNPLYALWYIIESSLALWTANLICCWPLIQKLFGYPSFEHTRSFYVFRDPIPARENPQTVRSRQIPCWSNFFSCLKRRRFPSAVEEDIEMNTCTLPAMSNAGHAASASVGTTILMHTELMEYLENESLTPHSQGLRRDNDTSPALDYRDINKID